MRALEGRGAYTPERLSWLVHITQELFQVARRIEDSYSIAYKVGAMRVR